MLHMTLKYDDWNSGLEVVWLTFTPYGRRFQQSYNRVIGKYNFSERSRVTSSYARVDLVNWVNAFQNRRQKGRNYQVYSGVEKGTETKIAYYEILLTVFHGIRSLQLHFFLHLFFRWQSAAVLWPWPGKYSRIVQMIILVDLLNDVMYYKLNSILINVLFFWKKKKRKAHWIQ